MNDFTSNLTNKLSLATEPRLFPLSTFASTAITTSNTVKTLASFSSNLLKAADRVEAAYRLVIDNQSAATELFNITVDLGTDTFVRQVSITNTDTDIVGVTTKLTRISSTKFLAEVNFIFTTEAGTITVYPVMSVINDSTVTKFAVKAENTSVVGAGCHLIGYGGYVLMDSYTTA